MTHVLDVVKLGLMSTSVRSFAKRPSLVTVWAVPMTMARILRSRMTVTCHVRVRHEVRSSRGTKPALNHRRVNLTRQAEGQNNRPSEALGTLSITHKLGLFFNKIPSVGHIL